MSTKGRENWEKYKAGYVSTRLAEEVSTGNAGRDSWNELKKTIRFDKPESTQDVVSGSGAQKDKKFDAGQYAEDAGKLFLNGLASLAQPAALVETWIGKGLDKLFPGAGFEGSGLFNALYNGRPDWKWAGENGLVGIKQDTEYNMERIRENAERTDSKLLQKAAEFGGDTAYALGNALPMAAEAALTGGASAAAALTKEGLLKTGAEVVEKSGVLNTLGQAARDMLTSRDYWMSFASEVGMDYYDALDSGATEDEALRYALSSAGLNSVIEIGGGIQKIPEKPTFRTWLKSAHEEGMEEIQQGIVSRLLENVVYNKGNPIASVTDENAVLNPVTALGEYAGGAAVGGILSGGQQLTQRGINNAQYKRAYGTSAQDLVKESLEMNPDNALATKLQKKLDAGKKLTGSELRQLVEQNEIDMVDGDRATIQTAAEARLTELGETENVPQVAEAIARQAAGERITDAEKTLLEGSERARQVRQELNPENIRVGATDEEWTGKIGTARVNRAAYNRGIQENGLTGAKYNAETGKLDAIVKDDQGKIQTVPAEKAELSPLQEELFDWAADLGEAGPVLVSAYRQTQKLETYARQFHNAYEYGKAGVPMDYVNKSQAVSYLNTTQREIAYEEGAKAHQRELQGRQEKKRSGGTVDTAAQKKPAVSLRGATVGGVKYAPVNKKAMDGRQWASVGTMKAFAQATGVDVVFYESQANERGEYEGANGFYKNGTLYLDINAGRDRVAMGETAILKTAAHEITHYIKEGSPEQYEVLKNFVVEKLTREKGISFDDLVTDKQRREPGLSYEEAVDEVVADACEMMLKDSKAVEQLARENRSLVERIRQWIRKWVRSLKAAMEGLTADRPESRAMMQYAQELQEIWDNALVDAARNGRGTMRENAPAEVKQQARVGTSESIKPDEKSLKGKRDDGKMDAVKDLLKEDLDGGEERKEDRGAFLRRATGEGLRIFEGDSIAYGYRTVPWGSAGENAQQVQKELTALGIDAEITEGYVHWNLNGISSRRAISQAVTIEKRKVLISNRVSLPSKNAAGHEAFHFWGSTQARESYANELSDNLNFSSKEFVEYQAVIAEAYLGGEADLSDSTQLQKLREELFAYISGDIHEGVNDDLLRPMFHDYDAVKAAWVKLCKDRAGGKVQFQQREPRLSDRAVLEWAAEMALRDKSKSWTAEDREQLERFRNRIRMLQDTQAELEALKEERKALLAGRKVSEITGEERTEVSKNKNRIDIAKNKAERYEAAVWELESKAAIKTLLKKSRSIVETEAADTARRRYREQRYEGQRKAVERRKVERVAKKLITDLNTNNDKKHIPEPLKRPIGELLESLDFISGDARANKKIHRRDLEYGATLRRLKDALDTYRKNEANGTGEGIDGYIDLPPDLSELISETAKKFENNVGQFKPGTNVIASMNLEDISNLYKILSSVREGIVNIDKMYQNEQFKRVKFVGEETMRYLAGKEGDAGTIKKMAMWDNTLPWYAFQRFGEGGRSIFEELMNGQDKFAYNANHILEFRKKLINDKTVRAWDKEIHELELTTQEEKKVKVTMTTSQLMNLYLLSRRKHGLNHILGGGIRLKKTVEPTLVNTVREKVSKDKKKLNQEKTSEHFKLKDAEVGRLLKLLTPEQIKVARALQKFAAEVGGAWGNEITMRRFGFRGFTEENYWTIEVDKQDLSVEPGDKKDGSLYRLQNISAVKPLTEEAKGAVVIRGVFDVFSDHMTDMAKYNAFVLPIIDAQRWLNYKTAHENNEGHVNNRSVQRAMTKVYGEAANNYVIEFLRDLNGVKESGDRGDTLTKRMISKAKRVKVALNFNVAAQQPTSYMRASAVLEHKYLAKAFAAQDRDTAKDKLILEKDRKELLQYSGIALWKEMGFFDTDIGHSLREQIKGGQSLSDKIADITMIGAEWGDKLTWARLWRACKLEVQDKQHLTGEAMLKAAAKRFREVIYRTQVVDSTLTRSHNMRSNSTFAKFSTAFMSEPTVSYNVAMYATENMVRETAELGLKVAVKRNWRQVIRQYQAVLASGVAAALVSAIDAALRDADDDPFFEKVWKEFFGEKSDSKLENAVNIILGLDGTMLGEINPLSKLPELKGMINTLSGFGSGRIDMDVVTNAMKAVQIWDEYIRLQSGDLDEPTKTTYYGNMTPYGRIYPTLKALSDFSGLPISNLSREVTTLFNTGCWAFGVEENKVRTYQSKQLREAWENYGKASGVSYAVMYRATQDTKEFESDKDKDGNPISGSLKAKYVDYIKGLGLNRAQGKAVWEAAKNPLWSDKGTPWG